MGRFRVPDTYVIIFFALVLATISTWVVPGAVPQTWQVFSALYEGFVQQAGIIAFVLVVGGAFWIVNATKAVDAGILKFVNMTGSLERYAAVRKLGVGNIVIILVMLLFGIFGAVFGMSEETIAFVAIMIPLAKSLGYDEFVGVCMVYVAAHVGFAGAMLNPFTIGIAQDMAGVPLFSGIEYRTLCWAILMFIAITFVLVYAYRCKRSRSVALCEKSVTDIPSTPSGSGAWIAFALITAALVWFSVCYGDECQINIGGSAYGVPWLLWVVDALFVVSSVFSLRNSREMFILDLLLFTVVFMVIGVMGYGWYLPEICALFLALSIASGVSAGFSADRISSEFKSGAKDIFSAALIIGLAAGIIVILKEGRVIDIILTSMAENLREGSKTGAIGVMYGIQTFMNLFIPSASAKAAATMPVMAPFADMISLSRQSAVLAFQFGDGFTNMITPCSGVLMAVLSVARIPYERWVSFIWKFILLLIVIGFVLLLLSVLYPFPGF